MTARREASITSVVPGGSISFEAAKVTCPRCDGFTGTRCPVEGCGVQLISIQAQRDEEFRARMREQEAERRARRAARRAERERKNKEGRR